MRQDGDLEFTPARYSESITPNHVHIDVPVEEQVTATFIWRGHELYYLTDGFKYGETCGEFRLTGVGLKPTL